MQGKTKFVLSMSAMATLMVGILATTSVAWFTTQQGLSSIISVTTGEIEATLLSTRAYRYTYETYEGSDIFDYDSEATIKKLEASVENDRKLMNLNALDPTLIWLTLTGEDKAITTQNIAPEIIEQKTAIVYDIYFSLRSSVDAKLNFSVTRPNATVFNYAEEHTHVAEGETLDESCFVSFASFLFDQSGESNPVLAPDFTESTTLTQQQLDDIYNNMATLVDSTQDCRVSFDSNSGTANTSIAPLQEVAIEASENTHYYHLYTSIDYEASLVNPFFFETDRLGLTYNLACDFSFSVEVSQA